MIQPRPVTDTPLPTWWHPLAERASRIDGSEITRFLPPDGIGTRAGVLVLLGADSDGPNIVLMRRASTLRHHPGQASFPGGVAEPDDLDIVDTALREATEEIGLDRSTATVVTTMPELWISVTDFRVTPVLAWWHTPHPIAAIDPAEVASVVRLPISDIADPHNRVRCRHRSGYIGPGFTLADMLVWGFTAGVLEAVLQMGGWERPWDRDQIREIS